MINLKNSICNMRKSTWAKYLNKKMQMVNLTSEKMFHSYSGKYK